MARLPERTRTLTNTPSVKRAFEKIIKAQKLVARKKELVSKLGKCRIIGMNTESMSVIVPYSLFLEVCLFLEDQPKKKSI